MWPKLRLRGWPSGGQDREGDRKRGAERGAKTEWGEGDSKKQKNFGGAEQRGKAQNGGGHGPPRPPRSYAPGIIH